MNFLKINEHLIKNEHSTNTENLTKIEGIKN